MTGLSRVDAAAPHGPVLQENSKIDEPSRSGLPCWTCRQRRLQCDRILPTCQKCHLAGRECLGYKKPLVWNKGVASRGKMMGRHFKQEIPPQKDQFLPKTPVIENTTDESQGHTSSLSVSLMPSSISIQSGMLVDPIFQDFKPLTRFYLDYYARKLSAEAVLHDFPGQNPWKDLMALIGTSPLLLKTMLAAAARDFTNFNTNSASSPGWSSSASNTANQLQAALRPSKFHALWYKQSALTQLRNDLERPSRISLDTTVASISLLIFVEILESGKDTWMVHLDGVKQLFQMKDARNPHNIRMGFESREISSSLTTNSYFLDACIVFDIMGTTLARPWKMSKPMAPTIDVFGSLQRSEKTSFIGCPADLLYLILVVNGEYWSKMQGPDSDCNLGSRPAPLLETNDSSIISSIQTFDPNKWAEKTTLLSPQPDLHQRMHLASAYQSAVLIYTICVLCPSLAQSFPIVELATQVIQHLSFIPADDPFLKCILWPTFIAGAETDDPEQRDVVRHLFHLFWLGFRSANAANAMAVLDQIWSRADRLREEGLKEDTGGWYDYLANGGVDWLFI